MPTLNASFEFATISQPTAHLPGGRKSAHDYVCAGAQSTPSAPLLPASGGRPRPGVRRGREPPQEGAPVTSAPHCQTTHVSSHLTTSKVEPFKEQADNLSKKVLRDSSHRHAVQDHQEPAPALGPRPAGSTGALGKQVPHSPLKGVRLTLGPQIHSDNKKLHDSQSPLYQSRGRGALPTERRVRAALCTPLRAGPGKCHANLSGRLAGDPCTTGECAPTDGCCESLFQVGDTRSLAQRPRLTPRAWTLGHLRAGNADPRATRTDAPAGEGPSPPAAQSHRQT